MRNAFSIFFIGTLFTITMGISLRYSPDQTNVEAVRKTSSVMDNGNCFTLLHVFLDSQQTGSRRIFRGPVAAMKKWAGNIAEATKFNWNGFFKGGFKVDYDKVTYYRELYQKSLSKSKEGFESLSPNSLNIDRNPESVLGFIYAFNRYERKFHWLEQSDLQDLGPLSRRRLHQMLNKIINQREFSATEYDNLMQEMMWKLFGKNSKQLMEQIIETHLKEEAEEGVKAGVNRLVRRAIYEIYVREMSSMALEKTTLFMGIRRNQQWWKGAITSLPMRLAFSGLTWFSLFKGVPLLPYLPKLAKNKLSYETMQMLITKGPTREFFETASKELSGRYGKDWAQNSFFITNQRYDKFRVWFQRRVAPILPFAALYWEYQTLSKEFEEANTEIAAIDAVTERFQQSLEMMDGLQDFGIILIDAYIPESPYEIPEHRIKELEEVRESHSIRACRQLKSCLIAKMQQMMDREDPSIDRKMDIEQQMLDKESDAYKFCKRIRDRNDECSHKALSVMVHSMIE
jgi:hypothetical protein